MNILLVGRKWTLEKRGAIIFGNFPEGEPPTTPKEYDQWQRGPKVRRCFQELIFRGFRVTVEVTEKDYPDLNTQSGALKSLGVVEEIISPIKAKFSKAGILKIQIRVVDETEMGMPPLTPDEKTQVCAIVNVLEGRQDAAQPAEDLMEAVRDEIRKVNINVDIALRKKEEAEALARDLQEHPMDVAGDIYNQFRAILTPRQNELYDALKETGGKQTKAGNRMDPPMSQKVVWVCIHNKLRPAIFRAKLIMPTWLMTREEKRGLQGAVNPPTRTRRGEITQEDTDEAGGEE